MKKILIVLLALLCVGAAFAEGNPGVSIGAWGRSFFTVGTNLDEISGDVGASWGGSPRIGFTIASNNSANVGFQVDLNCDAIGSSTVADPDGVAASGDETTIGTSFLGFGDNVKVWGKLLDGMITVQIGNFYDDTLRGNAAFGMHNWIRLGGYTYMNEDAIFGRVGVTGQSTFEVSVATSGFYGFVSFNQIKGDKLPLAEMLQYSGQYGAGYTIADIGTIRAQYIGGGSEAADSSRINAAFKLTAVKGLTVDLGLWMNLDDTMGDIVIPVFASYNLGTITVNGCAQVTLSDPDMRIEAGLGADVDLGNGLGLNADARLLNDGTDSWMGFGVGLTKGLGNGLIGVGLELSQNGFIYQFTTTDPADFAFVLPIRLEYWF